MTTLLWSAALPIASVNLASEGTFADIPFGMRGLPKAASGITAPSLVWVVISAPGYLPSGPWGIPQFDLRQSKVRLPPIELLADVKLPPWRVRGQIVNIENFRPISANLSVSSGTGPTTAFDVLARKMVMAVGTFDFTSALPPPYSFHASSTHYPGFYPLDLNQLLYVSRQNYSVQQQVTDMAPGGSFARQWQQLDLMIPLVPRLPNGQIRLVLTWNGGFTPNARPTDLELHTRFALSNGVVCNVGPLTNECGGAAPVVQFERPGVLGVQSILLSTVKQTKYLVWVRYPPLCSLSLSVPTSVGSRLRLVQFAG